MLDSRDYLSVCEQAVRAGGRVVQDWVGRFEVHKKGPADLLTQADLASQEAVRRIVLGAFPDHSFLGEETGVHGVGLSNGPANNAIDPHFQPAATNHSSAPAASGMDRANANDNDADASERAYRWIVDPLDGTTNYVHGVPHYCVSLGLEHRGTLVAGAVFDPVLNECFTAARGHGAHLNGNAIHSSNVSQLTEALAAVGFPPNVCEGAPDLQMFHAMIPRCQAIRRTGSSALNLCYLAAGRFDLYWSYSTRIWDVAAGVLIAQEAGGCVTSPRGGAFCLEEAHFLAAANRDLHAQLLSVAAAVSC